MRVSSTNSINFKGNYYITSNINSRLPMIACSMTDLSNKCRDANRNGTKTFFIDGGDLMGDCCSLKKMVDCYSEFKRQNPETECIFNLGNWEAGFLFSNNKNIKNTQDELENELTRLAQNGYHILDATFGFAEERYSPLEKYVKDYIVLDDKTDGKDVRVFVTGYANVIHDDKLTLDKISKKLDEVIVPAYKREKNKAKQEGKDFKTILIIHDGEDTESDKKVIKLAKEKGMRDIELVLGAQPHSIEDKKFDNTRYLRCASNGKSIYEIILNQNGFQFDKIDINYNDNYDYSVLEKNKQVIYREKKHQSEISDDFKKIIKSDRSLSSIIAKSKVKLPYRSEYKTKTSTPSGLGTMIATSLKNKTNCDLGVFLALDLREPLPSIGQIITEYDIKDTINKDWPIYIVKNVDSLGLRDIFNASLKKDEKGQQNQNFLEYSDNIKIIRYKEPRNGNKIKQIYIKNETGEFKPLFDDNGDPVDKERKFSIATTQFIADKNTRTMNREPLSVFNKYNNEPYGNNMSLRSILREALYELEKSNFKEIKAAQCETE